MNEGNLIPFDRLTESQQREIRSKGGRASAEAKKRKKTYAELAEIIGTQKVSEENGRKLKKLGVTNGDQTNDALAVARIFLGMQAGNPKMTELWLKLRGEMPKEVTDLNISNAPTINITFPDDGRGGYE